MAKATESESKMTKLKFLRNSKIEKSEAKRGKVGRSKEKEKKMNPKKIEGAEAIKEIQKRIRQLPAEKNSEIDRWNVVRNLMAENLIKNIEAIEHKMQLDNTLRPVILVDDDTFEIISNAKKVYLKDLQISGSWLDKIEIIDASEDKDVIQTIEQRLPGKNILIIVDRVKEYSDTYNLNSAIIARVFKLRGYPVICISDIFLHPDKSKHCEVGENQFGFAFSEIEVKLSVDNLMKNQKTSDKVLVNEVYDELGIWNVYIFNLIIQAMDYLQANSHNLSAVTMAQFVNAFELTFDLLDPMF